MSSKAKKDLSVLEKVALIRLQGKGYMSPEGEQMYMKLFEEEIMPKSVSKHQGKAV